MTDLFVHPSNIATRWATAENQRGEKGGACRDNDGRKRNACKAPLKDGETFTLAEAAGSSGMIRRIWITIPERSAAMLRGVRLEIFWDGAATPAVSAPLGDFFCQALGRMTAFENELFSSPEARSFCCVAPMPFRTGMRVVAANETGSDVSMFFYEVDYTLGDVFAPGTMYFHSHWRRENPTTMRRDYELLPRVNGRGRFLGVCAGAAADTDTWLKTWWGEGEVKIYLDGDGERPTLCGTGTEDYIGTGWGQGAYAHRYQGCPLADREKYQYGFYRLHIPDPVWFNENIRATIQQIGCWAPDTIAQMRGMERQLIHGDRPVDMAAAARANGYGLFERQDDWSSCAWFYLDRPENGLPALAPARERLPASASP